MIQKGHQKILVLVYRILKGKAIRFFSASKNWGHVVANKCGRGHMDPKESKINFAVPNERYLRSNDEVMGRIIPPGKIEESFKLLQVKRMLY